jgi:hypothetical protein
MARTAGFNEPEPGQDRQVGPKGRPVRPLPPFDLPPVIHPGAFELRVIKFEAERFNQVQRGPRGGTEPRDISGVGRNLGFEQNKMHGGRKARSGGEAPAAHGFCGA